MFFSRNLNEGSVISQQILKSRYLTVERTTQTSLRSVRFCFLDLSLTFCYLQFYHFFLYVLKNTYSILRSQCILLLVQCIMVERNVDFKIREGGT